MMLVEYVYFDFYQGDLEIELLVMNWVGFVIDFVCVYVFEFVFVEFMEDQVCYVFGLQGNVWMEYISIFEYVEYMVYLCVIVFVEVVWLLCEQCDYDGFVERF